MRRLSVRLRTTLVATAVVAAALTVVAVALVGVLRANLEASAAAEAERRATAAAAAAAAAERRAAAAAAAVEAGTIVGLIVELPDPDVQVAGPQTLSWTSDREFVVASAPVEVAGGDIVVEARASLQPTAAALDTLVAMLIPGIPALLLLVAASTWVAVGRTLAPVAAIRKELADITTSDLHRRVPVPTAGDEVALLATTTNRTLDRLERAVDRHQRFVADAAHELRSPLALLRTRMEMAPAQPLTTEAITDLDRIQGLTDDLLLLARLDAAATVPATEVDLGQVVAEEAARPRARGAVRVELQVAADVLVRGAAGELRRLAANLVDNAVRHACSRVVVRLRSGGGEAVLDVEDDGPGIPEEQREAVFDRFTRLDEARARDAGGAGLGLAIARDIARRHGGELAAVPGSPGGHLRATLDLVGR